MTNAGSEVVEESAGYLSPEFIEDRAQYFTDRTGKVVLIGCGDDRDPTEESAATLAAQYPEAMNIRDGYASVYGGSIGIAKNVLIAGIVQYGPSFVERLGGIMGAHTKVLTGMLRAGMIATLHSAATNEGNPATFNPLSENGVACAYAGGVGATSGLITGPDSLIRDVARDSQRRAFGDDRHFDDLISAHRIFLESATAGAGADFALGRHEYAESHAPIMILAGKGHTSAKSSGLVISFDSTKVRNSAAANREGKDFYVTDIAAVTQAAYEAFREYDLDPELLMRAFLLDAEPVRAVLAAGDADPKLHGKLDPRNLAIGFYGNAMEAVGALRQ